jgi:hypothetical protein
MQGQKSELGNRPGPPSRCPGGGKLTVPSDLGAPPDGKQFLGISLFPENLESDLLQLGVNSPCRAAVRIRGSYAFDFCAFPASYYYLVDSCGTRTTTCTSVLFLVYISPQ